MPPRHSKKANGFVVVPPDEPNTPAVAAPPTESASTPVPATIPLAVPPTAPAKSEVKQDKPDKPSGPTDKQRARINAFIRSLPDRVEATKELAWVRTHPAMLRRGEGAKGSGIIEITIEDMKRPPHGPAPSQYAIQMLKHHAQNPLKFFDEDLKVQHKQASVEEGSGEDLEELEFLDDLKEVDRMIREATKNTRAKNA